MGGRTVLLCLGCETGLRCMPAMPATRTGGVMEVQHWRRLQRHCPGPAVCSSGLPVRSEFPSCHITCKINSKPRPESNEF